MRSQLDLFADSFNDEAALRGAIQDLLLRMPDVSCVHLTHGTQEYGKDIVFRTPVGFGELLLCACVIKNDKIVGSVDSNKGAMTAVFQARQALNTPYVDASGKDERVGRVYIITPHDVAPTAMASVKGELQSLSGQVVFLFGAELLRLFETHYAEYLLIKSNLLTAYVSTLRHQFEDQGALRNLNFKHGVLGSAMKATVRAYVRPTFYCRIRRLGFSDPVIPWTQLGKLKGGVTANQLTEIVERLQTVADFLGLCCDRNCSTLLDIGEVSHMRTTVESLRIELEKDWEQKFAGKLREHGKNAIRDQHERQLLRVELRRGKVFYDELVTFNTRAKHLLADIASTAKKMGLECQSIEPVEQMLASDAHRKYMVFREVSALSPSLLPCEATVSTLRLGEDFADHLSCSVLISGPPGYGKTSFCKWSALHDGERFVEGRSSIFPIYVALNRFASGIPKDASEAFFFDEAVQKLQAQGQPSVKFRLYLDGLDEVPPEVQREVLELARVAADSRSNLQIIVTARDHVIGPWLCWLPRVRIEALSWPKVEQLVAQLLDSDEKQIAEFHKQLALLPALKQLLTVPLLCTLTTSVFMGAMSLPETKAELYRIFVDLLCGGWDMAKGVKRPSAFNATIKVRFLVRLASALHAKRVRLVKAEDLRQITLRMEFVHLSAWEELVGDIVQDGLLTRDGESYAFAHLSFQEYLCAKDLADPNTDSQLRNTYLGEFLLGDDWWHEVMTFYVGMSTKPREMERQIDQLTLTLRNSIGFEGSKVQRRSAALISTLREMFPGVAARTGERSRSVAPR